MYDSISTQQLKQVEISAKSKPSTSQSSTPLQVITENDILKQGISSVTDAVKRFNGVILKDYGGIGGLKTVSIRGMGAEYTAVSYDGMMVNNLQAGQVDIGRFSLDNISMLSLSIGQTDDIFLSAKTLSTAGILNLQTKKPVFTTKRSQLYGKVSTGSFGYFEPMLDYAYKVNNRIAIGANVNWQRADGQYSFINKYEGKRKRKNSDVNIFRSELNLYTKISETDQLDLKLYYFDSARGLPGAIIYDNEKMNTYGYLWDKNAFSQLVYNKRISDKWKFKSQLRYDYKYTKYDYTRIELSRSKYKEHEIYWSNVLMYHFNPKLSASISQDLIYSSLRSEFTEFDSAKKEPNRYNSYTSLVAQYKSDRLTITASGLFTYLKETSKNNKGKNYYRRLSPALSFSYKPFDTNLRFRASYKHIYRIPTFAELHYSATGKDLNAESASQYNLGFTWVSSFNNTPLEYINLSVDAHYNDIKDKIVIQPTLFLPLSYNLGEAEMKGIDTKLSGNIRIANRLSLDITGTYSYLQARDMSKETKSGTPNSNYKSQIPYTPKHSGSASLTFNNPWINLTYAVILSDKRYTKLQNLKEDEIKAYTDHSITLFKEMKIKDYQVYASGSINNLWNNNYEIIANYPMPRRAFRISVGLKF